MSTLICHRVARSLSERPIFMLPEALRVALEAMAPRLGLTTAQAKAEEGSFAEMKRAAVLERLASVVDAEPVDVCDGMAEYGLTAQGIAVIPIIGTLIDRYDWMAAWCGLVSYDTIKLALNAAIADPRVRGVILDVDSPGGEAAGMLDASDAIRAASKVKPVWAVANTLAASAGYGLAAAATKLFVPRLGMVGSVGVVCVHVDRSQQDKALGLKYSAIYSGAHKIDGWGHAPLPDDVRARLQARMDACRVQFASAIAGYRGMSVDAVMGTEADVFDDSAAVSVGFVDGVQSFDETLAALTDDIAGSAGPFNRTFQTPNVKGNAMTTGTPRSAGKNKGKSAATITAITALAETLAEDQVDETEDGEGDPDEKNSPGEDPDAEKKAAAAATAAAAEIVSYCVANGAPLMAAGFIKDGATMDTVKRKVNAASDIRKRAADARGINPEKVKADIADEFIAAGLTPDQAGAKLLDMLAAGQSQEIRGTSALGGPGTSTNADVASWHAIYAKLDTKAPKADSDADGWGAAYAKLNPPSNARR